MKDIFENLNRELAERKIPAKLSDEQDMLYVLLAKKIVGFDINGYVFFVPFSDEEKVGGYWIMRFAVLDVSEIGDDNWQKLCAAVAMINPMLPAGGYGLSGYTVQTESEDGMKTLSYQLSIPIGAKVKDEWLLEELIQGLSTSAAVLKKTASTLHDVAAGKTGMKEFMEAVYA